MKATRKNVYFYGQALVGQKTGVGYYNSVLLRQLINELGASSITVVYFESYFKRNTTNTLKKMYPEVKLKSQRFYPRKIAQKLVGTALEPSTDLLWSRSYSSVIYPNFYGFKTRKSKKFILSIPDLAYLKHPEVLPEGRSGLLKHLLPSGPDFLKRVTLSQIPSADAILTISETVKNEILDTFNIAGTPVIVTSLYPSYLELNNDEPTPPNAEKYILFVGTVEPRKNIVTLLDAYEKLSEDTRTKYRLIIAGQYGWRCEEIKARISTMQKDGYFVEVTGYISSDKMQQLFTHASIYVQPSLYEGFGLPLLEAMFYKIPVVCSDIPIFKEVAEAAALYFNTMDSTSLANSVETILSDSRLQAQMKQLGSSRLAFYKNDNSGVKKLVSRL
jgi:glycosyltransferase involved in cell wall biosynthesis